ncbi:MAG: efflux RND transporter periplasmic adaptor subunit [Polyangiaceae bacterium]|nr:efflux RND transporter periplasmic adaptor subunit [Polyangiaceae bacterium]
MRRLPHAPKVHLLGSTHARGLAAALALIAALAPACKRGGEAGASPEAAATAKARPSVRFAGAESRPLAQTLDISGTLAADETSEVAAQANGVVVQIAVDVGARVKKGDALVVLDARNAQLQSSAASAAVSQARAKLALREGENPAARKLDPDQVPEVRAAKQAKDLAQAEADRIKKLYDQGAVPSATWDEARTRAETAAAQYEAAVNGVNATVAALTSAQAQAGLASKALSDTTVRAPFDGAVAERRISVGEFAGIGRVVAVVVKDNPLRLRIDVPEADIARVEIGKPVEVSVAAYPGVRFPGTIKRIAASLKAASRTLLVEAEIDNSEGKLRPGLFAQGELSLGGEARPAILVPEAAIGSSGSSERVFVRAGDRVIEKLVKRGRKVGGMVEVIGPVAAGDEVAIDEIDELADSVEVIAVSDGSAPAKPAP